MFPISFQNLMLLLLVIVRERIFRSKGTGNRSRYRQNWKVNLNSSNSYITSSRFLAREISCMENVQRFRTHVHSMALVIVYACLLRF